VVYGAQLTNKRSKVFAHFRRYRQGHKKTHR
jgi:hypothetical protein